MYTLTHTQYGIIPVYYATTQQYIRAMLNKLLLKQSFFFLVLCTFT